MMVVYSEIPNEYKKFKFEKNKNILDSLSEYELLQSGNHRALIQQAQHATSIVSEDQGEKQQKFKYTTAEKLRKINKSIDPLHQSQNYSRTTPVSKSKAREDKLKLSHDNSCIQKNSSILSTETILNENPVNMVDTQENEDEFEPIDMNLKSSNSIRKHSEQLIYPHLPTVSNFSASQFDFLTQTVDPNITRLNSTVQPSVDSNNQQSLYLQKLEEFQKKQKQKLRM